MKIVELKSIPSTNDFAKSNEKKEDFIIVAEEQTAGRGSKNRSFHSGMGGLYLTKLTYPVDFLASNVFQIMCNTTVAVCKTLEDFGLTPTVKWPNDVFVNGKKICGILIENTFAGKFLSRSIVGVGLNVNNILPLELRDIATTMQTECKGEVSLVTVKENLIARLKKLYSLDAYKKYVGFLGEEILLFQGENSHRVIAKDIDQIGRLVVEKNDVVYSVTAGEVSVRLIDKE